MGLIHLGFHFGSVLMRFLEVACVTTRISPYFAPCVSQCTACNSDACHSGAPDFPEFRVYSRYPLGLVHLGFHFGRVLMRFLEEACVTKRLTPYFALGPPHSAEPVTCTLFPKSLGSSATGIPFWPRSHASLGSGMRACFADVPHSAQPVTLTYATPASLISRSCASIPEVPGV